MSELPQLDLVKIEQRLLSRLSEQTSQNVRLEVLAEALRDERDNALRQLHETNLRLDELQKAQEDTNDTPDGQ